MSSLIGVFGGTFDPIHNGHLRVALEVQQILQLSQVRFIPCKQPVHKEHGPYATDQQRLAMLQLAIAQEPSFIADDREITRHTPSYMVDTLISLKKDYPKATLCLLLGLDSFLSLPSWHHWQSLLSSAHLIVMTRPGCLTNMGSALQQVFEQHQLDDLGGLQHNSAGSIYVQDVTSLEISATAIRSQLKAGLNPRYLLPDDVLNYIHQHQIYQ
jgi:nicotinate-nucleotide adenylyltransferase